MDKLKIFCWNIANPSLKRATTQFEWLKKQQMDVLVLTETKTSKGCIFLERCFKAYGYNVIYPRPIEKEYGVMVISKLDIVQTDFAKNIKSIPSRIVAFNVSVKEIIIDIIGTYVPSRDESETKINRKKEFISELIFNLKLNNANRKLIFCGDLNIIAPEHYPHYPHFQNWEYNLYNSLSNFNMIDAYKIKNPNKQAYSWFNRKGNGFRFDYSFVSKNICNRLDDCYYNNEPRQLKLSDHSAIVTILNV